MILHLREKKETGFSLLELSVAVGVSAIVATAGIVATTAFIGSAQDKRDSYTSNANSAIENAEASSLALGASGIVEQQVEAPGSVVDFYSTATNATTAAIVWTAPFSGGAIDNYLIIVGGETIATLDGSATSYTVTGLTPNTTTAITIRAVNTGGTQDVTSNVTTENVTYSLDGLTFAAHNYEFDGVWNNAIRSNPVTGTPGTTAASWSLDYPVLVVEEFSSMYAFIALDTVTYGIDYYDNSGNNNPTVVNNVYHLDVGGVPDTTPGASAYAIYYDADPTAGAANALAIDWVGACDGTCPSGK